MAFGWLCGTRTKASRRYTQRILAVMSVYVVAVFATTWFVRHHHPVGAALYALAAVPTVPILGVLVVVALYLKEEQDEFQRMVVVRVAAGSDCGRAGDVRVSLTFCAATTQWERWLRLRSSSSSGCCLA